MTVWDRPEPPSRPVPLDRDRIVTAAIALADEGGLDAVSLRKVAARLNAGPMRLYGYIATKEELYDLMVDAVHAEIVPGVGTGAGAETEAGVEVGAESGAGTGAGAETAARAKSAAGPKTEAGVGGDAETSADPHQPPGDWREALRTLAHRTRRTTLRHEWLADLLGGRPTLGPHGLAVTEAKLAALDGHTDIDTALRAVETVSAYVTGALRREIAHLRAERATGLTDADWQRASGPHVMNMLATGRFPALAKAVHDGTETDAETTFATGLDWVLDAIATHLTR
ncbi:TetR/AcrR family transcriptional regulator [Streptomyces sp. V2]|uniref:TetR/AcrR family transcriptional regulator n=1 Tax=Streptomyces sp. V2 TaxID=1424099 RepID=UPI001F0CBB95|nr:TetR/AcrR family transcriptional regulator C-terminal domain-containing protein [Streptomyces sp. V2]